MANQGEVKFQKRRLRSSYISVVLSVSLVLFTLGLLGLFLLYTQKISNQVMEDIGFTVYLHDDVNEVDVERLTKAIEIADYTNQTEYISKDQAIEILKKDLGEDFMQYLDYNPLLASIDVKVIAAYANTDSLAVIKSSLSRSSKIKEIVYQESLIQKVQENLRIAGIVMLVFSGLLLIVAIALINNSIRLSIYSRRFIIKSMQLVGATQGFIRRPFVIRGVLHGIYSALIAILLIMLVMYCLQSILPDLIQIQDIEILASLFVIVMALGIIISWVSTSLAVRKFLRMRGNKMY
ncbi:permease-like cell division protein FtsX [bacterium]|jgi:cell division transport system permease protein|nr:permease-like cell division protein FtsX [bacterium]